MAKHEDTKVSPAEIDAGVKFDDGKPRMDLIPPEFLKGIGRVLCMGASKYAARNWEKGMDWGRLNAAALRHLTSWMRGQDLDEESKENHLLHAAVNLMFLYTMQLNNVGTDTRTHLRKPDLGPGKTL